jgi:hypothetical protein
MVDRFRNTSAYDANVVDNTSYMWKEFGNFRATLAMAGEGIGGPTDNKLVTADLCESLASGKRGGHCLTIEFHELWFKVKGLELRDPTALANKDNSLCSRREMGFSENTQPFFSMFLGGGVFRQKRCKGNGTNSRCAAS